MKKPSTVPIVIVAILVLVIFGYANNAAFFSGSHPDAEQARQTALSDIQASKQSSSSSKPATAPSKTSGAAKTQGAASGAALVTELTVGDPATAKTKLTFGYSADDQVAQDPDVVNSVVSALQNYAKLHPGTSLQVACVDIPDADRTDPSIANIPMGIAKNGQLLSGLPTSVGSNGLDADSVKKALG